MPAFSELQRAGELVAAAVTERISSGRAAGLPLEAADRQGWQPSYAVANCYRNGSEGLGPHSDRLTPLGPCPVIASVTLGATRTFRLRRTRLYRLLGFEAGRPAQDLAANVHRIDIELPHNSLLILWPPVQECWLHEVRSVLEPAC
jgi:hypothetical protein